MRLKETNHDYQNCIVGNYFSNDVNGSYNSWEDFKNTHLGFMSDGEFDDRYHYIFRYDIYKASTSEDIYTLELCMMLQRKGIYSKLLIHNIDQETLDSEIYHWLYDRYTYIKELWKEVE